MLAGGGILAKINTTCHFFGSAKMQLLLTTYMHSGLTMTIKQTLASATPKPAPAPAPSNPRDGVFPTDWANTRKR